MTITSIYIADGGKYWFTYKEIRYVLGNVSVGDYKPIYDKDADL